MYHFQRASLRWAFAVVMLVFWALTAELTTGALADLRTTLCKDRPSDVDHERMVRGYYEKIIDIGRNLGAPALGPSNDGGPDEICETVDDLRQVVLRPNLSTLLPSGATWTTNALGMRDRPCSIAKPPGTFRVAMTGDSIGVGLGVDDGLGFGPLIEDELDKRARAAGGLKFELLNCAVPGRGPGQRWFHFREVGWRMSPDLVVFEATQADVGWDERRLVELLPRGIGWDLSLYGDALENSGIWPGAPAEICKPALAARRWELLGEVYRAVADECAARGLPCIWILLPRVNRTVDPAEHDRLVELARSSGFTAVVDVADAFDEIEPALLELRPNGYHPNARGHALLARRLTETFWARPEFRPLHGPARNPNAMGDERQEALNHERPSTAERAPQ